MRARLCSILAAVTGFLATAVSRADPAAFLEKHCSNCHDAETRKGGLDVGALRQPEDLPSLETWVRIWDRVRSGEMPPKKKARPEPGELRMFLTGLERDLRESDLRIRAADGRSTLRRLTRVEYENAVRDLFSMPHLEVQALFPPDGTRGLYDKAGEALDFSEIQLGVYMDAAEFVLERAICTQPTPPTSRKEKLYPTTRKFWQALGNGDGFLIKNWQVDPLFPLVSPKVSGLAKNRTANPAFKNDEFVVRTGAFGLIRASDPSKYRSFNFIAPVDGEYRMRVSAWSFLLDQGHLRPNHRTEVAALWSEINRAEHRWLAYFDAPSFSPTVSEFQRWLPARSSVRFETETVRHADSDIAEYTGPGIAVDWIEMEGPLFDQWPTAAHRRLFGDLPIVPAERLANAKPPRHAPVVLHGLNGKKTVLDGPLYTVWSDNPRADARRLLEGFLQRAFRRPVRPAELDAYVGIVERAMKPGTLAGGETQPGECFETAMRDAYKTALCSTQFLLRAELPGRLEPHALASRLALWLWNSIPDEALLAAATRGDLSTSQGMQREVERMLRDPRSARFVADFLNQWLNLGKIDDTTPDRDLYPEFSHYMKNSMVMESQAFLREMLEHDLSVSHVIGSSFGMLNGELARLYGIPGVDGHAIRRVDLPPGSVRGGFIGQAAVHKVTANGTTTSPVLRGKWFNERILGMHIPLPPPNVGSVEPDTRGAVTIRDQLEKHRRDESCAACHAQIDPPGFAMELFDVIGGERRNYRSLGAGEPVNFVLPGGKTPRFKQGLAVDCAGQLPDGSPFADFGEFRKLLLGKQELVARNVLAQLLEYASGAPLHFADRPALEELLQKSRETEFGFRSMIHIVAGSALFQQK